MINIEKILLNKQLCLENTGLEPEAFAYILKTFEVEYMIYANKKYKEKYGKPRDRKRGGRSGKLHTMERKLFFVLFYLKSYPSYAVLGSYFDMEKSRAYERIENTLVPLMEAILVIHYFF